MNLDLNAIRTRAERVLESMGDDTGPEEAEPYASWAEQACNDVLALLSYINKLKDE